MQRETPDSPAPKPPERDGKLSSSRGAASLVTSRTDMMDRLDVGFWDFDVLANRFHATETWRRIRGLASDAKIDVSDQGWTEAIHADDRKHLLDVFEAQKNGDMQIANIQYRHSHPTKGWVWILCRANVVETNEDDHPTRIIGVDTEISELKEREAESINLAEKLRLAIEVSGLGIFEFDPEQMETHWDDRMLDIYGVTDGVHIRANTDWDGFLHPDDREVVLAHSKECDRRGLDLALDYRIVREDGDIRHIRALSRRVFNPTMGERLIGINLDITEDMKRAQDLEAARNQLKYEALHDALTGLGNRRFFDEAMDSFFADLGVDESFVLGAIDLDDFKALNDRLGHAAGDSALVKAAKDIVDVLPDTARAFRVGGDEFMFVIPSSPSDEEMAEICGTLISILSDPFTFEGNDCQIGASIGFVRGVGRPEKPSEIFVKADTALYAAKREGRGCFRSFDGLRRQRVTRRRLSERKSLQIFEEGALTIMLQPQFDARTLSLDGVEALARWQLDDQTSVTTDRFLDEALRNGRLAAVDRQVFAKVLELQDVWYEAGLTYPTTAVNVSLERLTDNDFCQDLNRRIKPHHALSFELLETAMYDHLDDIVRFRLDAIREAGIRVEVDDFGSGHASILSLQSIHPDRIKFDASLVKQLTASDQKRPLLEALIDVARLHNAEVLLEGIETESVLNVAQSLDCDALQGFALGRPMAISDFEELLEDHSVTTA